MRRDADQRRIASLLGELGGLTHEPTTLYLVGGATAVLKGWRESTVDVDVRIEPERDEILRAIPELKERLSTNVELASPVDFLPELPGWRDRSEFVDQIESLTVRHFDFYAQALAKLERGIGPDQSDVEAMVGSGAVEPTRLRELFHGIEDQLYRFPAVDRDELRAAVERLVSTHGADR
jgi:hypothetical protein